MNRCGVDFGTSNSAVALPSGRLLTVSPTARDPRLFRSVLFFPEEETTYYAGEPAIEHYVSDGAGRFVQSVKSWLPSTSFRATQIRNRMVTLEELVNLILRPLKAAAEASEGVTFDEVVMGRPAVFHPDPTADALAERRLLNAAQSAGFESVRFLIEPIAAALTYEAQLTRDELVLVADFGAGTSDFTLMRLGPSRRGNPDRRTDVVGSSGLRIAGDRFDAAIMKHKLLPYFGEGTTYTQPFSTQRLPVPRHILSKLLSWHEMSFIRESSTQGHIALMQKTGDRPETIDALHDLVMENLGYQLFRAIEAAKVTLSKQEEATVHFEEARISIHEKVTRAEFDAFCQPLIDELDACVQGLFEKTGMPLKVDAVFLTGGTSQIPLVRDLFARRFGADQLRTADAFTSVAEGLGRSCA